MKNNIRKKDSKISNLVIYAFSFVLTLTLIFSVTAPMLLDAAVAKSSYNTRVAAGSGHYLMIDTDGNVWAFGSNDFGQLGDGSRTRRDEPVKVYSYEWEGKAKSVAAGSQQSLVLLEDGRVLQWGFNNLSNPIQKPVALDGKAVEIAAGEDTCMAILESGNAVIWSNILNRRIIRKSEGNTYLPNVKEISVGSNDFILLRDASGYAYEVNVNDYTANLIQREVDNSVTLSPTEIITPTDIPTPTEGPGSSEEPTVTVEPTITPEPTVTPEPTGNPSVEDLTGVVAISAGRNFGVALLATGDVYTWGNPQNGVLGYSSIEYMENARKVDLPGPVKTISAGFEHTIVVLESNTKYGWGKRTSLGLNPSSGNYTGAPAELNIATGSINQISSGSTGNIVLNFQGDLIAWGQGLALKTLELTENLFLVEKPEVKSIFVGNDLITVEWTVSDYYTEMLNGFVVTYKMPDGTTARTQLLPVNQSNISLRGLQPETNYTIMLTAFGKTGFEQTTEETVIMTLKADAEVSPTPTDVPTPTLTEELTATPTEEASSDVEPINVEPPTSIFGIILIILAVLILITAITAIIFVWKKIDREENPKIKPVRITPVMGDNEDDEDSDYSLYSDEEVTENGTDSDNNSVKALWNDVESDDDDVKTFDKNSGNADEDILSTEDDDTQEDDFLTRLPETHEFEPDDDDDFIVRKP